MLRDVVIRAYDCLVWGGIEYAKSYCHRLVDVFTKDDPTQHYRVTRAVVWNLAKVMLIKDEIYVAAMCTSPEKYRHDRRRFNVNPAHGDKIIYRHYNVPEIDLWGRSFRSPAIKTYDWQHRLLSKMRWLRPVFFGRRRETEYRDWYQTIVDRFSHCGLRDYERWLAILSTPEKVTGFREVRYPKMAAARQRAEQWLKADPELFEPEVMPAKRTVNLPVLAPTEV
jgi:indolepyruvate ferredoxin oxidoreductase